MGFFLYFIKFDLSKFGLNVFPLSTVVSISLTLHNSGVNRNLNIVHKHLCVENFSPFFFPPNFPWRRCRNNARSLIISDYFCKMTNQCWIWNNKILNKTTKKNTKEAFHPLQENCWKKMKKYFLIGHVTSCRFWITLQNTEAALKRYFREKLFQKSRYIIRNKGLGWVQCAAGILSLKCCRPSFQNFTGLNHGCFPETSPTFSERLFYITRLNSCF